MRLGSHEMEPVPVIPTGVLSLDIALGVGGFPKGEFRNLRPGIFRQTTLALHVVAEAQKRGGNAAFIDAEHALDTAYAGRLGVDIDNLLVSQPDFGEQALEIAEILIRSGGLMSLLLTPLPPWCQKLKLTAMSVIRMGLQARLMSQAMRKFTGVLSRSNTILIFINQIRMKIGVMFGNPETTTGGNALKFYSSLRLDIRKIATIKEGTDNVIGNRTKVKVVKNKVAPPLRPRNLILFMVRNLKTGDLLDLAAQEEIVSKSGSWYSYQDERIGQGRENAKKFLPIIRRYMPISTRKSGWDMVYQLRTSEKSGTAIKF